ARFSRMTARLHTPGQRRRRWGTWLGSVGLVCAALSVSLAARASSANGCVTESDPGETSLCWTQRTPATIPSAREAAAMAADRATGRVVLFGGLLQVGNTSTVLGDTWTWDGSNWTQQHPATSPPARDYAAMATDPATGHVVLFGGFDVSL